MTAPAWQVWTALGLVYVLWGSTYLGIRYAVETMPPMLSASSRFALAGLLLAGWIALRRGRAAFRATPRQLLHAAVVGLLLLGGGNGMVTLAEERGLPSGLTALLVAVIPLWVVLLRASTGDRPSSRTVLGVAIGFVGLAVLLLPGARPEGVALLPAAMVVLGSLLWSIGSFGATRVTLPPDPLTTTVAQMAGGSAGLLVAALAAGERVRLDEISGVSWGAWTYLVVFGSVVAFTAYSWLLGVAPVSQVSTYAYVNPVVAVFLGWLLASEPITPRVIIAATVIVAGVAVIVTVRGRRLPERRAAGEPAE